METIAEKMTREVKSLSPSDTVREAAELMRDLDVGVLPVCASGKLVGIVTDRDIVVRGLAYGGTSDDLVSTVCTTEDVRWCYEDQEIEQARGLMEEAQIRRIPIISREKKLVGILSLGDLATRTTSDIGSTVSKISQPGH